MPVSHKNKRVLSVKGLLAARARPYRSLLFADKKLPSKLSKRLKSENSATIELVFATPSIERANFFGIIQPEDYASIPRHLPTSYSESLESELHWGFHVIKFHAERIQAFLKAKHEIERMILLGHFLEVQDFIDQAKTHLGVSWWLFEVELFLAQKQAGLTGNKERFKKFKTETKSTFDAYVASLLTQKIEDSITAEEFARACQVLEPKDVSLKQLRTSGYLIFKLNQPAFSNAEYLPFCLWQEERYSIFDRYLMFTKVLQWIVIKDEYSEKMTEIIKGMAEVFDDSVINILAGHINPSEIKTDLLQEATFKVLDLYTGGTYGEAALEASTAIMRFPTAFEFYELSCKSTVRAGLDKSNNPLPDGSISHQIWNAVFEVVSKGEETEAALKLLIKLSDQLSWSALGAQIRAFYLQHSDDQSPLRSDRYTVLTANVITPKHTSIIEDHSVALDFLKRLQLFHPENTAVKLFESTRMSLAQMSYVAPSIKMPESRLCKYKAYVLESLKSFAPAFEAYEQLGRLSDGNLLLKADAIAGQYRCLLELGEILDCANIVADVAIQNTHLISTNTLSRICEEYSDDLDEAWLSKMAWPIIHFILWSRANEALDFDRLHDVLDNFLSAIDIKIPTELRTKNEYQGSSLIFILKNICTVDVLQSSIWFASVEEVERERMKICEWLIDLDPDSKDIYEDEVKDLTRRATIRDLTHRIGQSKVSVDVRGIKAVLPTTYSDHIDRCVAYTSLAAELRSGFTFEQLPNSPEGEFETILEDLGIKLFSDLFNEVKQEFLFSTQYGLDSTLSQRIRHGTLSGEIRAQFDTWHLITQKDSTGDYADNEYWLQRLNCTSDKVSEAQSILRSLSAKVDSIVQEVRSEWIQVKAPSTPRGLFDYDFSKDELSTIYNEFANPSNEDVENAMFDILIQRTTKCLGDIRIEIEDNLKAQLFDALDDCQKSLDVLGVDTAELRSGITSCKTQLGNSLSSISSWFQIDMAQEIASFKMSDLFEALSKKLYSEQTKLKIERNFTGDTELPGKYFRAMWDLLFILLDNVVKHSGLVDVEASLEVEYSDKKMIVSLSNKLSKEIDRKELGKKLQAMNKIDSNTDENAVRKEGGSGVLKLHKIIKYDLGSSNSQISFKEQKGKFTASIQFELGE